MDDINNLQDGSFGGIRELRFAPKYFFSSLNPVIFYSGYDWILIDCTSQTMLFNENGVDDANGGYIDTTISGSVPQIRPEVSATLEKYRFKEVIVKTTDHNDLMRLAGTTGPLILTYQSSSGQNLSDDNGYQIKFAGKQLSPSLFL